MRTREKIQDELYTSFQNLGIGDGLTAIAQQSTLEVLLDIRDLLTAQNATIPLQREVLDMYKNHPTPHTEE